MLLGFFVNTKPHRFQLMIPKLKEKALIFPMSYPITVSRMLVYPYGYLIQIRTPFFLGNGFGMTAFRNPGKASKSWSTLLASQNLGPKMFERCLGILSTGNSETLHSSINGLMSQMQDG